jgi:hypothetical protein
LFDILNNILHFVYNNKHSAKLGSKTQPNTEVMDKKQQKKIILDIINPDNIKTKPFNIALVKDIMDYYDLGEVSFSRMVEMLNDIAIKWHEKNK